MTTKAPSRARARYVQVAVNAGRPTSMTFSYRVPPGRAVAAGEVVHVPFGQRTLQGIVVEGPTDLPGFAGEIRELDPPIEGAPRLGAQQLELAAWIAREYLAPPWEAHALMLPPGSGERPRTLVVRGQADPGEGALRAPAAALRAARRDAEGRRRAAGGPPPRGASRPRSVRSSGAVSPSAATSWAVRAAVRA